MNALSIVYEDVPSAPLWGILVAGAVMSALIWAWNEGYENLVCWFVGAMIAAPIIYNEFLR